MTAIKGRSKPVGFWTFCGQIVLGSKDPAHSYKLLCDQYRREHRNATDAEYAEAERRIAALCRL